jgi:glycerol-3-phosphate dehydrogenase (NAD(P)+)
MNIRGVARVFCLQIIVSCTKGILNDTLETVNQILMRVLPEELHARLAYLSGPSFAAEVLQQPTQHCNVL